MVLYLIIFFVPLLLFAIWKINKINQYWSDQGVLQVPPLPIVGNMWPFLRGEYFGDWLQDLYNKYGDVRYFGIYEYQKPVLFIKDTDLVKKIMIKDFDSFTDHRNFFTESKEPVLKDNLFSRNGEQWRQMRSILSPAFTSSKMRVMFNLMSDCAQQFTSNFEKSSRQITICSMKDIFTRYANDVVATCAFGVTCDSMKERNNEFFLRGQDVGNFGGIRGFKLILFSAIPNLMNFFKVRLYSANLINFFRSLVTDTIDIREKNNIFRPDMIQLLMEARKGKLQFEEAAGDVKDVGFATTEESKYGKDASIKHQLSDDELAAQVFVFFLAGFDTSSSIMTLLSYELAVNVDIQKKLQQEIDEHLEQSKGQITYEGILKLQYLDYVIAETLRLWMPVFFLNRVCTKSYTIPAVQPGERTIELKPNDIVWIPSYCIQRDAKYFPNPQKFDPDRYSDENKHNINPYSYLPFGIGPRNCIGSRFALLEIKILMVSLLSKVNLKVVNETNIPPKFDKKQLLISPKDGIVLGLELRKK